jgi:phage pi2 protein 07
LPVTSATASTRRMIEKLEHAIANAPDKDYWNGQILACKAKNSSSTTTSANVTCDSI